MRSNWSGAAASDRRKAAPKAIRNSVPILNLLTVVAWEAAAVAEHIANGLTDSPLHPIEFAIDILETMDEIRKQVSGT